MDNRHERADSNQSSMSSSIQSSVCTPHQRDNDDDDKLSHQDFFSKKIPSEHLYSAPASIGGIAKSGISDISNISTIGNLGMSHLFIGTLEHANSFNSIHADTHINIKIFDPNNDTKDNQPTTETWMNIRHTDTAHDVISPYFILICLFQMK